MRLLDEGDMPSPGGGSRENEKDKPMKNEPKVKKLVLRKETLRDLTAQNTGEVKGGSAACSRTCYCTYTCKCHYSKGQACHYTHGKPCH